MSEPVYRIKPLVWETESGGEITKCDIGPYWISAYAWGGWTVQSVGIDEFVANVAEGTELSIEAAKLAAEAAYRKLIAEHLEVVK